jgi:hypothetical protein
VSYLFDIQSPSEHTIPCHLVISTTNAARCARPTNIQTLTNTTTNELHDVIHRYPYFHRLQYPALVALLSNTQTFALSGLGIHLSTTSITRPPKPQSRSRPLLVGRISGIDWQHPSPPGAESDPRNSHNDTRHNPSNAVPSREET